MLGLTIKDILTSKGSSQVNEDRVGFTDRAAWVIDGATGFGKNYIDKTSDAVWYVSWWHKFLEKETSSNLNTIELMKKGIKMVREEYLRKSGLDKIDVLSAPSASIAIVRLRDTDLEFFILGDCNIYLGGNSNMVIKDDRVGKFDNMVYSMMNRLNCFNLQDKRCQKSNIKTIRSLLETNRKRKNTQKGYWILSFEEEAVDNSINGIIKISNHMEVFMASDGFTCSMDKYRLLDELDIISTVKEYGLRTLLNNLRKFERGLDANRHPRFKTMDDSSCILVSVESNCQKSQGLGLRAENSGPEIA